MSRSSWKAIYASRKYLAGFIKHVKFFRRPAIKYRRNFRIFKKIFKKKNPTAFKFYFGKILIRGRNAKVACFPKKNDSILRLSPYIMSQQSRVYGISVRIPKIWRRRLRKFYITSKYMLLHKHGEFVRTRKCGGFRVNKDRKKLEKLKKDIEKAEKRYLHARKEKARLMRKAVMETREALRKKAGKKPLKKKK